MPDIHTPAAGTESTRLFGLIGYPLSHSFSEKFFSEKFHKEKLYNCKYGLFPIPRIEELPPLLKDKPALEGLNVTIPYKQSVIPFLHNREGIPAELNACNCIHIRNNKLFGFNTDITGFEKSIAPLLKLHHKKALVLGTGGAAAAVLYVLGKSGIVPSSVSREKKKGVTFLYNELNREIIESHPVIINTTPLGMYPATESCPDIPYQFITSKHLLYDLVYNPAKTLFLAKGEERGAVIKNGEEMLILQAEESWKIWNS